MIINLLLLFASSGTLAAKQCQDFALNTCEKCLMQSPNCAWCADDPTEADIAKQRIKCGTESDLRSQGCVKIKNEKTSEVAGSRVAVQPDGKNVLMAPQKLEATLRLNDPFKFKINFTSPSHYPIDMYYLMDLSQSMKDDLKNLKKLAEELYNRMRNATGNERGNIRIGHGSFVDKTVMPFVSTVPSKLKNPCDEANPCEPPYTFRNNLALDENLQNFQDALESIESSSNLDAPEAGLDAMMQAIVCDDIIGWDKKRHKLLVYSSDATFHVAGDGKLGGILEPNDMKCHTEGEKNKELYVDANKYDYPSIGQIIDAVTREQILVIFAVTKDQNITYQQLKNLLPSAEVGILGADSTGVIDIIVEKYKALRDKVELRNTLSDEDIHVNIRAQCENGGEFIDGNQCENVGQNQTVQFEIEITWTGEPDKGSADFCKAKTLAEFSIFGVESSTLIDLNFICDCKCEKKDPPSFQIFSKYLPESLRGNSELVDFSCNGADYTTCGQCECPPDKIGNMCECNVKSENDKDLYSSCINPDDLKNGDNKLCSGKESGKCICGQCYCKSFGGTESTGRQITGKFCECDNDVCHKDKDGKACGGPDHGECDCKQAKCKCKEGWTGESCSCTTDTTDCINPADRGKPGAKPCSGKGDCNCGSCSCWDFGEKLGSYYGTYCDRFASQCDIYEDCVLCVANAANSNLTLDSSCVEKCILTDSDNIEYVYVNGIIFDDVTKKWKIDPAEKDSILKQDPGNDWGTTVQNGRFCPSQDENNCRFAFTVEDISENQDRQKIKVVIKDERTCPEPVDPMLVAAFILGGVVLLGLIILALIKMIIWWISRREVKEWEKERGKNTITSGQNPLYEAPETRHGPNNVKYRPGQVKTSAAY